MAVSSVEASDLVMTALPGYQAVQKEMWTLKVQSPDACSEAGDFDALLAHARRATEQALWERDGYQRTLEEFQT